MNQITRRDFVHAGCTVAAASLMPSDQAEAFWHGAGATGPFSPVFNGGKMQLNLTTFSVSDFQFPFLNIFKSGNTWQPAIQPLLIANLDANGYPTSNADLAAMGGITATLSFFGAFRSTNYVAKWTGYGTLTSTFGFNTTQTYTITGVTAANPIVVSFSNNTAARGQLRAGQEIIFSGGSGTLEVAMNGRQLITAVDPVTGNATIGGVNGSGLTGAGSTLATCTPQNTLSATGGRCCFVESHQAGSVNYGILNTGLSGSAPFISNLIICHVDDEALIDAGGFWNPTFLAKLAEGKPGVIRFMNWQGASNGANDTNMSTWSTRKPLTYAYYCGDELRSSIYMGVPTTSNGHDFAVVGSATITERQTIQVLWGQTAAPPQGTVTLANPGGATNFTWTGNTLSVGDPVQMIMLSGGTLPGGILPGGVYYVSAINVGGNANVFNLSLTSGGASLTTTSLGAGGPITVVRANTLSINPTGTPSQSGKVVAYANGGVSSSGSVGYPILNRYNTLVYESELGTFIMFGQGSSLGLRNGIPPELFFDLCARIGAHPHICAPFLSATTVAGPTDYMQQAAQYAITNFTGPGKPCPWMIFRGETINEEWNPSFLGSQYAAIKGAFYWGASVNSVDEYEGMHTSLLGQQLSAVYSADRTKYRVLNGVQSVNGSSIIQAYSAYKRTVAPLFSGLATTPFPTFAGYNNDPGYVWASTITTANYTASNWYGTQLEAIAAIAYNAGDLTQPGLYIDSMTNTTRFGSVGQIKITAINWKSYQQSFASGGIVFVGTIAAGTSNLTITGITSGIPMIGMTVTGPGVIAGTFITGSSTGFGSAGAYTVNNVHGSLTSVTGGAFTNSNISAICGYEGGYNFNDLPSNVISPLFGATKANPCVVTLPSTSGQGFSNTPNNVATVGGFLTFPAGIIGMTQLSGNTYKILAINVGGDFSKVSLGLVGGGNLDSTGFSSFPSSAVTLTNGSPGNVNFPSHGLSSGNFVVFFTTGALPTGILPTTSSVFNLYFVATVIDANNFTVSATSGGADIVFSGTQNGTQTCAAFGGNVGYAGGAAGTVLATTMVQSLRYASLACTSSPLSPNGIQGWEFGGSFGSGLLGNCDNLFAAGWEFPSCFQFTGGFGNQLLGVSNPWARLTPAGIYSSDAANPEWLAFIAASA